MSLEAEAAPTPARPEPIGLATILLVVLMCASWGLNYVAVKLVLPDVPPLMQGAFRGFVSAALIVLWMVWRKLPIFARDSTLWPGLAIGFLFTFEFILVYIGLSLTTAGRSGLFLYTTPFFVVAGAHWLLPAERFTRSQFIGLGLAFVGVVLALGAPGPAASASQLAGDLLMLTAALFWAGATLVVKTTALNRTSAEKILLYQLVPSGPVTLLAAFLAGEPLPGAISAASWAWLLYQAVWVVAVTYLIWFALTLRHSASKLAVFSFLTPLFGIAAGALMLGEPVTVAFIGSVVLVSCGLIMVNWPR